MADTRIDDLRAILSQAATRDADLEHVLTTLSGDLLKELGRDDPTLVWSEIKAAERERQVTPFFVMEDIWLRGDLQFAVTAEQTFVVSVLLREVAHQQHEAGSRRERSRTLIIDRPDPKDRAAALKKFSEPIFADLEHQVRVRVALPAA